MCNHGIDLSSTLENVLCPGKVSKTELYLNYFPDRFSEFRCNPKVNLGECQCQRWEDSTNPEWISILSFFLGKKNEL